MHTFAIQARRLHLFRLYCNKTHVDAIGKNSVNLGKRNRCPRKMPFLPTHTMFSICWTAVKCTLNGKLPLKQIHTHSAPHNAIRSLRPLKIALLIWIVSKSWWIRVILRWLRFPYSQCGNDTLQYVLPWMSIKDLMRDFLWLQNLIILYWSTSCTANCSLTCAITAPGSTFTTSARIRQPWHPGISRFSGTAWPEAWSILHQKRYEYFQTQFLV